MDNNEKFWKIMFEELNKTSQEDWEQFVKEHDKKQKKIKTEKIKMKFEYSKEKYMYNKIKDELPFDDDSYTWRSDEYGIYGLDFYPVEVPGSDGKLAQCFGKNIALETYASYDSMYLTKKSAIDFEIDKIIFKNIAKREELDFMYELMMLKQKHEY